MNGSGSLEFTGSIITPCSNTKANQPQRIAYFNPPPFCNTIGL